MSVAGKVSVVLPVRNGARYLADALRSVAAQTVPVLETVLVDGHSDDASIEIAGGFAGVRILTQQGPALADAYNEGVESARGDFVAFLAYDDIWSADKLELQLARLAVEPPADICGGLTTFAIAPEDTAPPGFRPELLDAPRSEPLLESLLLPRAAWQRVGPIRGAFGTAGDTDWLIRARDLGLRIAVVPQVVLYKRVHSSSTAHTTTGAHTHIVAALRESVLRKRERSKPTG
jgi:glycosyltransferase involved in cell wall biosynthesis